ncbi:MAG: hypothetical protein ACK43K_03860, partial [Chitinophagales bacterium]
TKMDSFVQQSLKRVLAYCDKNTIWQDAIDQIYIAESGKIELVLVFMEPIVKIGYVNEEFENRMNKVNNFIKTVVRCHDFSNYEELDFQYSQQVIAKKKSGV